MPIDPDLQSLRSRCATEPGSEAAIDALLRDEPGLAAALVALERVWTEALGSRLARMTVRLRPGEPPLLLLHAESALPEVELDSWLMRLDARHLAPTHPRLRFGVTGTPPAIPAEIGDAWNGITARCRVARHDLEPMAKGLAAAPERLRILLATEARLREVMGPALTRLTLEILHEEPDGSPVIKLMAHTSLPYPELEAALGRVERDEAVAAGFVISGVPRLD